MDIAWILKNNIRYNAVTFLRNPLSEFAGSLGDLGTLLPIMTAMTVAGSISLPATLVFSGTFNVLSGIFFGVPIVVQPMKAIAAVSLARNLTQNETMAAGIGAAGLVLLLTITGMIRRANSLIPVPIIKGIQMGAGLTLVLNAGTTLSGLELNDGDWYDNGFWALGAFVVLYGTCRWPRFPYALLLFVLGCLFTGIQLASDGTPDDDMPKWRLPRPFEPVVPSLDDFSKGFGTAGLGQVPLTVLNSIIAVASLSYYLLEDRGRMSVTAVGWSIAVMNLVGCWFGAMPVCHGSGGLAGQYRFGARSGASVMILGILKILIGLFLGESLIPFLQKFPKAFLGIMVFAAGMELMKVGEEINSTAVDIPRPLNSRIKEARWTIMMVTIGMFLAFRNAFIGFIAGLVCWGLLEMQVRMDAWGRGGAHLEADDTGVLSERTALIRAAEC